MPVKFTPDLIPRFDSTFLSYVNTNMQRLKQALSNVADETISTTAPTSPYAGQRYTDTTLGIDYVYSGTAWIPACHWGPYITYTPTMSGTGGAPTLGNGSISGAYKREGSNWHIKGLLTCGTTTVFGTATTTVTLPAGLTTFNSTNVYMHGKGFLNDTGVNTFYARPYTNPNDTKIILAAELLSAAPGYSKIGLVTTTVPFTWGNGDFLDWDIHIRGQ